MTFAELHAILSDIARNTQCTVTGIALDTALNFLESLAKEYGASTVTDEQLQLPLSPRPTSQPKAKQTKQATVDWGDAPF